KLKTTSRLHFWLAEEEAHLVDPEAYPLLLDQAGNVCELNAANFWIIRDGTIVTPPDYSILAGITRMVILELAEQLGVPVQQVDFQLYDVVNADEAFLTTTSRTILPVTRANGRPIGTGQPGSLVKRLQLRWIKRYDFEIVAQVLA